jgi:hypothetical protein
VKYDVSLVELALDVLDDLGTGGHVWRQENIVPVLWPAWVPLVVVRRRRGPFGALLRRLRRHLGRCRLELEEANVS